MKHSHLEKNNGKKIIVLCGFSGSGKDTILKKVINGCANIYPIVSSTTRPIRGNEKDGVDYNFVSKDNFLSAINSDEMLEYRSYNVDFKGVKDTWFYGVSKQSIDRGKNQIAVLDIKGLQSLKTIYKDEVVSIFIDLDEKIRRERAIARGDYDEVEWERRYKDDKTLFSDISICDHVVCNKELNSAVQEVLEIINKKE